MTCDFDWCKIVEPHEHRKPREGDRRVVQMNYAVSTNVAAKGARAYLVLPNGGGGHDRICILVKSRGGRWVEKWEDSRRLTNLRAKTVSPGHPLYDDDRLWDYEPEQQITDMLQTWEQYPRAPLPI